MKENKLNFEGPFRVPKNKPTNKIMFLFHGYGANGDDLIELSNTFSLVFPDMAFYAPNAPFPLDSQGFYMPSGYQWFSLDGYDPVRFKHDKDAYISLCNKRFADAQKVLPDLWEYIDNIVNKHNVSYKNVVIAGFSQGGLMSLLASLLRDIEIGAAISFSGVPVADSALSAIKNKTPVFLSHGDEDDVVPFYSMDITEKTLSASNNKCERHLSNGISHGIDKTAIDKVINFLEKNLLHK